MYSNKYSINVFFFSLKIRKLELDLSKTCERRKENILLEGTQDLEMFKTNEHIPNTIIIGDES